MHVVPMMTRRSLYTCFVHHAARQEIIRTAMQIAAGMSHLHGEGVVHRDLAARNILVDEHYNCRVGDFGYARLLSTEEAVGQTAASVGPVKWMAPESMRKQYSARSDVWAFGVTLYEMVKGGEDPWLNIPVPEVCSRVMHGETLAQYVPLLWHAIRAGGSHAAPLLS